MAATPGALDPATVTKAPQSMARVDCSFAYGMRRLLWPPTNAKVSGEAPSARSDALRCVALPRWALLRDVAVVPGPARDGCRWFPRLVDLACDAAPPNPPAGPDRPWKEASSSSSPPSRATRLLPRLGRLPPLSAAWSAPPPAAARSPARSPAPPSPLAPAAAGLAAPAPPSPNMSLPRERSTTPPPLPTPESRCSPSTTPNCPGPRLDAARRSTGLLWAPPGELSGRPSPGADQLAAADPMAADRSLDTTPPAAPPPPPAPGAAPRPSPDARPEASPPPPPPRPWRAPASVT